MAEIPHPRHRGGKIYVTILCGAGDRPIAALKDRTPLEHADTPHLDRAAAGGMLGMVQVINGEITPESDSGAMAILGYDPLEHYTGRGALESLGMGYWKPKGANVAFRINFASQDAHAGHLDRRTARDLSDHELQQLASEVREQLHLQADPQITFELTAFGRHRGILSFTSTAVPLSGNVTNTDPGFRRVGPFGVPERTPSSRPQRCEPLDDTEGAANTAQIVNEFVDASRRILAASDVNAHRRRTGKPQANIILARDGGHELPMLENFTARTGLTLSLHGQIPAEHGLCKLIGGCFFQSQPARGQTEAAYYEALATTLPSDPSDVVLVHLKGADEPAHDNLPLDKVAALERIDRYYVGPLLARVRPADVVVLTGDHITPCELGIHASDPVPTAMYGSKIAADETIAFSERAAATGALPVNRSVELLAFAAQAAQERES